MTALSLRERADNFKMNVIGEYEIYMKRYYDSQRNEHSSTQAAVLDDCEIQLALASG